MEYCKVACEAVFRELGRYLGDVETVVGLLTTYWKKLVLSSSGCVLARPNRSES
jgi:hypothetical protein